MGISFTNESVDSGCVTLTSYPSSIVVSIVVAVVMGQRIWGSCLISTLYIVLRILKILDLFSFFKDRSDINLMYMFLIKVKNCITNLLSFTFFHCKL